MHSFPTRSVQKQNSKILPIFLTFASFCTECLNSGKVSESLTKSVSFHSFRCAWREQTVSRNANRSLITFPKESEQNQVNCFSFFLFSFLNSVPPANTPTLIEEAYCSSGPANQLPFMSSSIATKKMNSRLIGFDVGDHKLANKQMKLSD